MNLYELNNNYNNLLEVLENTDDQNVIGLLETSLNEIREDKKTKVDNIVKFIKNLEGQASILKVEERNLADKRKSIENKIKNLKTYLQNVVGATENRKLEGNIFKISIRTNRESVSIVDESLVPKRYFKKVISVDKTAIAEAVKNGERVEGIEMVRSESLSIR